MMLSFAASSSAMARQKRQSGQVGFLQKNKHDPCKMLMVIIQEHAQDNH
jgi:hypothetical protein